MAEVHGRVHYTKACFIATVLGAALLTWGVTGIRRTRHTEWNHQWCAASAELEARPRTSEHSQQSAMIDAVIVRGISGLGNNLFQLAAAIFYAETYGARIVLDAASSTLRWGTANFTNRDKARRSLRGHRLSYFDTLFDSPKLCWVLKAGKRGWPGPITRLHNDYSAKRFAPPQGVVDVKISGRNATTLQLTGYNQHRDLFLPVLHHLPSYLNLDAGFYTRALLRTRYDLHRGQRHAIMLGVRRGADFAHMTKVGVRAYERALRTVFETRAGHATPWTLVVLADTDVKDMRLADRASAIAAEVSGNHMVRTVVIAEDDITQLHAGLTCDHFILSESTFHYWIAVLRGVVPPRRPGVQVVVFEGTDLTNRPLALEGWTRLPYR